MKPILPVLALGLLLSCFASAQPCSPQGDQVTYGTNNVWIGYAYDNTNFTSYRGYINEGSAGNPNFDEDFDNDNGNYNTHGCRVSLTTFSVRFRLRKTFSAGYYTFLVGGDDGFRLSIDGGATWIIDQWYDQAYTTASITVPLNGTYNMVLEYYENSGENRISFNVSYNSCMGSENTTTYGANNVWNGYVYDGTNFDYYKGMVTEGNSSSPNFDQNFGGSDVSYSTSNCNVQTETFSVRYRLKKNFPAGSYRFTVGADDGYRLSLDGGGTWAIDNWNLHSYTSSALTTNLSSGTIDMVLEFYENTGDNRISFNMQPMLILPVNLLSFSGQQKDGSTELKWQITRNSDPSWFEVQRSKDASSFSTINRLQGQADATYSNDISYQYNDLLPSPGTYYYRLKMTDMGGAITYSPMIMVQAGNNQTGPDKVFPTLMTNNTLYLQSGRNLRQAWYTVHDMNGRLVYRKAPGKLDAGQVINVFSGSSSLPKGSYILNLRDGDEDISRHRFVIP
ncbi:MAG: T9SS type A sorting domain-containing protein [Sphingobacteriales bacterium]|nr:T9SS type A sorting domain-containing protein [Sphingobacteriales bacterium]OJW03286.1 MAG: hypothetical protein BGO52_23235 [Sphingobacteriales bacterium 44-61]